MGLHQLEGLSVLNPSPRRLPGPNLLHQLVPETGPSNRPAVDYLSKDGNSFSLSYEELQAKSDALAARISRELALLPERIPEDQLIIPLLIPQSPQLYIAQLAILKAGGAFCPLNLDAPADRIKFIIGDVKANLILATPPLVDKLPESHGNFKVLSVDESGTSGGATEEHSSKPAQCPAENDLAYVMYTSGSTGTPKGVGISHTAATQSLLAHDRHIPAFSRFLQFAAPTFDVSVFEIFFPLFRGNTLVCCDRAKLLDDLPGVLRKMNVDACELTPSVAGSLLQSRANAPSLKLVLTIGEMLTQPVVDEFGGDLQQDTMLWGMYGPTEAAIHCTLQPAFSRDTPASCIGFPFDTVSAFVIGLPEEAADQPFQVLPIGQIGELAVGGHQLAAGYINRPEETTGAFINTEFGRVYKTGDRARMTPDGTIECHGRVSEGQIKLNGQRMELGEIEHVMLRTNGCHGAFVTVISNVLVAFAAVKNTSGMEEKIIATCKTWLAPFMVPSEFIVMKDVPRLPSGKIDRLRLKQDYMEAISNSSQEESSFQDDLERLLCVIAGQILRCDVRPSTKLTSAGFDSLSSIDFAARLREKGYSVNTLKLMEARTISNIYDLIQEQRTPHGVGQETSNNQLRESSDDMMELLRQDSMHAHHAERAAFVATCTSLQTSMIIETMKDSKLYMNEIQLQFPQNSSPSEIRSWIVQLAQANEILRTGFLHLDGDLVQVIWKELSDDQVKIVNSYEPMDPVDPEQFLPRPFEVIIEAGSMGQPSSATILIHHAIYDGWTFDLFLEDICLLAQGRDLPHRPQFRDFALQLNNQISDDKNDAANEFWAEHLKGSTGSTLPNFKTTAVSRPQILTRSHNVPVNPATVKLLSLQGAFGPQAIFQGCLVWLWGAIMGSQDIIFGSVSSGRTLPIPGIERVMGPCIQTLPMRVNLGEYQTLSELIQSLHNINRQILHRGTLSLADIKRAAALPLGSKLFHILFVYQESLASRTRHNDRNAIREIRHKDALEVKLLLEIEPRGDEFSCQWTWHSDVFNASQIESFGLLFSHLVQYFTNHLDDPIKSIGTSFPPDCLSTYTSGLKPVTTLSSLSELVEKAVAESPQREALCFAESITKSSMDSRSLTYDELNRNANKIARYILDRGVTPGGIVAIIMEKSSMFYCGILGILKTGCAYLPILPSIPIKRMQLILKQAQPGLCIVDNRNQRSAQEYSCPVIDLNDQSLTSYADINLEIPTDREQLAYIIYTSGTSGAPKGVSVTNKNMLSNIEVLSQIYPHTRQSKMLQACSQAFDVSVFEIFFAWANGMCLCAATNDTLFENLERSIRKLGVTHLSMTVTVASLVNPTNVPNVEFLVTSGEAMTDEVLAKWSKQLFQGYGPSETTNICTVRKVAPGDCSQYLGWSLENTSSFVFSPDSDDILPLGSIGELVFGGDQVATGYLNMPELTAQKFFEHRQHGRLYRSGDLGRMMPDGSLVILGRLDTQIKLRGQRIELQEIHAITLTSGVARACTSVLLSRDGSQQLALYYVPSHGEGQAFELLSVNSELKETSATLLQALQSALPSYMIPTFLFPITSLPLTSSGKTDNRHLQESVLELSEDSLSHYSSHEELGDINKEWTDTENQIADMLAETLKLERRIISRWSSFASLGLDSISAMPLARKLQSQFKKRIPISQVLQNPSVCRLAQIMATMPNGNSLTTTEKPTSLLPAALVQSIVERTSSMRKSIETVMPCTPLQEAMLASSVKCNSYCNQLLFRLRKAPDDMMKYWNEMRIRHGILRTCFVTTEDPSYPMVQVVLDKDDVNYSWARLEIDRHGVQAAADEHMKSVPVAIDSFEVPLSLAIIEDKDGAAYLSCVCHHALYDGVAMEILLFEVESLSRGHLLRPSVPFDSFLADAFSLPPDMEEFWKKQFHGFIPTSLPNFDISSRERPPGMFTQISGICISPLSSTEVRLRELGVSLLSICQAAWGETLSAFLNAPDVCFGNVVSGRSIPLQGIDALVAPCFNTIPVRMNLDECVSNRDLARKLQDLSAIMLPYQFTPVRKLQNLLGTGGGQLFDTLLLLQPPSTSLDGDLWELKMDRGEMDVPIICEVVPAAAENALKVIVHRDVAKFSEDVAKLMHGLFLQALEMCLQYPSSRPTLAPKLPEPLRLSLERISRTTSRKSSVSYSKGPSSEEWNQTELKVRSLVARLSGHAADKITKETSIHRLGLDSISAVQIAHFLRQDSFSISAVDVLENPTCVGIASHLRTHQTVKGASHSTYDLAGFREDVQKTIDIDVRSETVLPCTPLQQGMVSQFILSEGRNYFNHVSWSLDPQVDLPMLLDAWKILVSRHQILRTGFINVNHKDSSFAMLVHDEREVILPVQILVDSEHNKFDVKEWQRDCARGSLNDLSWPPWQVVLVKGSQQKRMHMAMHHALYDAHSLRELLRELLLALNGHVLAPAPLLEDTVTGVLEQIVNSRTESETFWKSKVDGFVVNSFPVMTPLRVNNREILHVSRDCNFSLSDLREKTAEAGVTLQAALQSAWTRLLSCYHGEQGVTFGVVLSGRSEQTLNDASFPQITTMPVIAQNSESNRDLLQSMMEYNFTMRRHEHTPLSQIQKWIGSPDTPLFDTILVYQQMDQEETNRQPWYIDNESATVDYPVSLEIEECSMDKLRFNLDFYSDVIPLAQAGLMLEQYEAILINILHNPEGKADDLMAVSSTLFSVLPAEDVELPTSVSLIHEFVEESARVEPNKLALEFVDDLGDDFPRRRWTYRELDEIGNRVANFLVSSGIINPGGIVAVLFDKCPEAYFSILGIIKAGCAFVALDPGAPAARKEFILKDSGALALLVKTGSAKDLELQSPVQVLEVDQSELNSYSTASPKLQHPVHPEDTVYCLYTSGTTGTPKGCLITHDNCVQAILAFQNLFAGHWDADSRWLQFASLHFDVSVLEQYWSWSVGIAVVSAPRDLILSDLISIISKLGITHIDLTPSLARLVHPDDVPSLCKGVFITGGEQLRQDILDVWGEQGVIYNAYGPTEATIGVTMFCRVPKNGRSSNIGKQFPNVGSYILRPGTDIPVLRGGVGELCVSGRLVGKGYLNRDDLTEERFTILDVYGERVYRTGDLVRVLHDGCFDFLGRTDDQVKLRGQRLEIGEINHAIRVGEPAVVDVATLVTKHGNQDRDVLVSFIVTSGSQPREKEIYILSDKTSVDICKSAQDSCRAKLPGYMVPTYFFCISFIPLSANNKTEVKVLQALLSDVLPGRSGSPLLPTDDAPLSETEPHLTRILSEVSRVEIQDIKRHSTIFDLGIDSISVIELARRLVAAGFAGANPSALLKTPRLNAISQMLREKSGSQDTSQIIRVKQLILATYHRHLGEVCATFGVDKEDVEYVVPCTPLQEGMLTRSATDTGNGTYFNTFQFRLAEEVGTTRLREAWQSVFHQNAILRTVFLQTTDGYIQVALKNPPLVWSDIQLDEEKSIENCLRESYGNWLQTNTDVMRQPLQIDTVLHGTENNLVVRIFHGLYDARSFHLILQSVEAAYNDVEKPSGPPFIDVLPLGLLCDFSSTRSFWENLFENFEFLPMPCLTSQLPESKAEDVVTSKAFSLEPLEAKRLRIGVTQQTMVQSAWLAALHRHISAWPTLGIVLSGRSLVADGIENTIGPLFNTLPFRVRQANPSWDELIQETHQFNTSVLSFTHVPLHQIQKWCSKGRPLFDNLFTFDREDVTPNENYMWREVGSTSQADYPLAFEAIVSQKNELKVTIVAQSHIGDSAVLMSLLDNFESALLSMSRDDQISWLEKDASESSAGRIEPTIDNRPPTRKLESDFVWTEKACQLRLEMAALAEIPEERVKEDTSMFELGLNSIDAVKFVARLRRLGIQVTTNGLMKLPTIQDIIASLDKSSVASVSSSYNAEQLEIQISALTAYLQNSGYDMQNIEAVLPPTPLQDSMVAEMVMSEFQHYFNHDILEISPGVDVNKLRNAMQVVVENSPVLRTTFVEVEDPVINSVYCQTVRMNVDHFCDVNLHSEDEFDQVIESARQKAVAAKGASGLLQLTFASVNGRYFLVLSIAHALYDGTSLDLFHKDVEAAYDDLYRSRRPYKPMLASILASSGDKAEKFWAGFLQGCSPALLTRANDEQGRSDIIRMESTSKVAMSAIKSCCAHQRITTQALGQACWAAVLSSIEKSIDVIFGVVLSGRDTNEAQEIMFPTLNTVPVRVVLHGTRTEYLQYVWNNLSNINEVQHFPLRQAQRIAGKGPLFNTLFTMQNRSGNGDESETEKRKVWKSVRSAAEVGYPVCVEMEIVGDGLVWRIACDQVYVTKDQTEMMIEKLDQVLGYFVGTGDADAVKFGEETGHVSVCGLPDFSIREHGKEKGPTQSDQSEDKTIMTEGLSVTIDVLAEISGVQRSEISPDQSIYNLGLDSISAIKVSTMLRKRNVDVSVRDLIGTGSIGDIALKSTRKPAAVMQGEEDWTTDINRAGQVLKDFDIDALISEVGLEKGDVAMVLPILPVQVHMLSVWQHTKGELFFSEFTEQLPISVTTTRVGKAWGILLSETPILRTRFAATGSDSVPFIQVITRFNEREAYHNVNEDLGEKSWILETCSSPFALLRVTKYAQAVTMKLKIHHALYDGVSLPLLISRFKELCASSDAPPAAMDTAMPWSKFVLKHYDEEVQSKRRAFWTSYLAGAPFTQSTATSAIPNGPPTRTAVFGAAALGEIHNLKAVASTHGVTIQSLFFAAHAKILAAERMTSGRNQTTKSDVVFGIYLANRYSLDEDLQSAPYPTLAVMPLRVRFNQNDSLIDVAQRIQDDIKRISTFENVSAGLWEIAQWTGVKLGSFDNFLSLPIEDDGADETLDSVTNLAEPSLDELKRKQKARTDEILAKPDEKWILKNCAKNAYLHGVDVEAAVRGHALDIGVFGSSSLVSPAGASILICDIVEILGSI